MQVLLLYCFWYLQMNSTVMEQKPHIVQNNDHQRRQSVLPFWGKLVIKLSVGVALNIHQYPLRDEMCDWVRLNVHHLPNQRAQDSANSLNQNLICKNRLPCNKITSGTCCCNGQKQHTWEIVCVQ